MRITLVSSVSDQVVLQKCRGWVWVWWWGVEKGSAAINDPPSQSFSHGGGVEKGSAIGSSIGAALPEASSI